MCVFHHSSCFGVLNAKLPSRGPKPTASSSLGRGASSELREALHSRPLGCGQEDRGHTGLHWPRQAHPGGAAQAPLQADRRTPDHECQAATPGSHDPQVIPVIPELCHHRQASTIPKAVAQDLADPKPPPRKKGQHRCGTARSWDGGTQWGSQASRETGSRTVAHWSPTGSQEPHSQEGPLGDNSTPSPTEPPLIEPLVCSTNFLRPPQDHGREQGAFGRPSLGHRQPATQLTAP